MAEKPILFNTEMVRAILDGRKTQTRRLVKPKHRGAMGFNVCFSKATGEITEVYDFDEDERMYDDPTQPPYHPGDVLYVRETWADIPETAPGNLHYRADATQADLDWFREEGWKWRPSIHMPKEAARLFLRVTGVRCERLQDITAKDAFYEGTGRLFLEDIAYGDKDYECDLDDEYGMAREQFAWLWESTLRKNDMDRYGWWANPWVWVIEFERIDRN